MRIGFIGLGTMGEPMARNLLKAGFELVVFSKNKSKVDEIVQTGAKAANSPKMVARDSDIVISMVPSALEVNDIVLGDQGILRGNHENLLYVDMSTIGPKEIRKIGALIGPHGIKVLDAPVSGGRLGAENASLTIMVGGAKDDVERCMPVFKALGSNVVHMGELGAGQTTKLCNQVVCDLNILATCEGLSFAIGAGLDLEKVYDVLVGGAANSWVLQHLGHKIINEDFATDFSISFQKKDAQLSDDTAQDLGVVLPGTAVVNQLLRIADALNLGEQGSQSIMKVYEVMRGKHID